MVSQACPPPSRRGRQLAVKGGLPHHLSADLRVWHVRCVGQAADQPGKQAERRGTLSRGPLASSHRTAERRTHRLADPALHPRVWMELN
jgi:hypothetical protein